MLPTRLHSGILYLASPNRMFPPNLDLTDDHQASSMDLFTFLSREAEKTLRHSAGLSVPQSAYDGSSEALILLPPQETPSWSTVLCFSGEEESPRAAAATPGAHCLPGSLQLCPCRLRSLQLGVLRQHLELEQWLRFFACRIKSFRRTSFMYSSPELMERIRQMEGDYETAIRQFYCQQPSPGLQGAAAAAEQPTPGLQGAAAAEQPTSGLQSAAAEQSTPGLQPAVELPEGPEDGLPPLSGPEHLLSFLWGVLTELKPDTRPDTPQPDSRPDTPQPDTPQLDTPQPDTLQPRTTPDPRSASTSSVRRRGRRKRDASAHATEGLCNASAPAHVIEGPADASAPAHVIEGPADASAPAHVIEGPADASAPAHVIEGPVDASAPSLQAFQGFSEKLILVLASEPCDEGFEEEAPPDPVSEGFEEQLVHVLASEPCDEEFEKEAPSDPAPEGFKEQFVLVLVSEPRDEGSPGAASASEGSPGFASISEGSPGSQPVYEAPGSQPVYEALAHCHPPELCACWGRPPSRPPELCFCFYSVYNENVSYLSSPTHKAHSHKEGILETSRMQPLQDGYPDLTLMGMLSRNMRATLPATPW
ncbi:hypothetical protein CRENBAI_005931 [Crenichthys baileyi]|uniref:Uncharacterized protein n=1 Tax=Crenichthys baileyi TaxID=28760 RepID=A0AAV9R4S5_9TELE